MGTEWLVTIWRWKIYVFSNWWLVSAAAGGLQDIPGHWGFDLIWWRHRVWVAPGQGGPRGNYLSPLYCQIIDSIREIGATSSHLDWTRDIPGQMRLLSGNISHPSEPEPCAPCVSWEPLCAACHMRPGTKTHSGERSRCLLTGTPFKRAARGLRGLSTEHLPQFKLELGHEKFKMDPCNF